MNEPLDDLLAAAADDDARGAAPPHVRMAVLGAWDARHAPRPAHRRTWWLAAAAAVVLVAAGLTYSRRPPQAPPAAAPPAGWYSLGPGQVEATDLSVVRLRMSRGALATLGVPLPAPDTSPFVEVNVIVGEDGVARAIQPVVYAAPRRPVPAPARRR